MSLEEAIRKVESEAVPRAGGASRAAGGSSAGDAFRSANAARATVRDDTDPLAELARIIGQTDPFGSRSEPPKQVSERHAREIEESLAAAKAIGDKVGVRELESLARHLTPEQRSDGLAAMFVAAKAIGDKEDRVRALASLAPHLAPEQRSEVLAEALAAAIAIGNESQRTQALVSLAPLLAPEQMAAALAAAMAIGDASHRAQALESLAPHLAPEQMVVALATAPAIGDEGARAHALASLLRRLAPEQRSEALAEALAAAKAISDEFSRARALGSLVPHLPAEQRSEALAQALASAEAIGDEFSRGRAMGWLAPYLVPEQRSERATQLPPISILPEQNAKRAIAFRPSRRGPLELLPDSTTEFLDPEQSQLYARMRAQLTKLQEDIPSQERSQIDDAINDFLDQPPSWQAVEFKKVLWLCGNALRNKLALHDAVKDDRDPHYSKLPAGVAAALSKPVETWNVFVLGDEDLVELDSKRLGPQERQTAIENINAARPIVEHAAIDRHITTEQTGQVLTASLQAASAPVDNVNTRQAQSLAEGTSRNLVVQIVRRAYLFCQDVVDPRTDEARALALEYKKGIAAEAGKVTVTAATAVAIAAVSYGALHAASFFEFVAGNAEVLRTYIAIAFQNDQLRQVIDVIEYTRTSLNEKPSEEGTQRRTEE